MGTKMGPSYACLFVGFVEQEILKSFQGPQPLLLKRYIDDYVGVATCPLEKLNELITHFNDYHPCLKFTHNISEDSLPFLDIQLLIDGQQIKTSVHYKRTDAHCYLNYSSSHPPSCKQSIPFSQLTRLRRLCSDDQDFRQRSEEMTGFFRNRGYPEQVIQKASWKASSLSRRASLHPRQRDNMDRVPLVLTYHPSTARIVSSVMNNTAILKEDETNREIFKNPPMVAYKKDRSLRNLLVHSRLPSTTTEENHGTVRCGRSRCNTCKFILQATTIKGPKSTWIVRDHFTCTTTNVIYVIVCTACEMIYVGETKRRMADRTNEHLRSIRLHTTGLPVAHHFNLPGHSISNFKICGIVRCSGATDEERKIREERMIHRLGCLQPNGVNAAFRSFPMNS